MLNIDDLPFSNREIQELFKAADERADAFHSQLTQHMTSFELDVRGSLARIEMQTTKHNGRMTSIERWQYMFIGGIGVLTVIVVPLLVWALSVLSNIDGRIQESTQRAVDQALSAYDIPN